MAMTQLVGVADSEKAPERLREVFERFVGSKPHTAESFGIKSMITPRPNVGTHDGVRLLGYATEIDTSGMPPEQLLAQKRITPGPVHTTMAAWDDVLGLSSVGADGAGMRTLIDAARGKGPRLVLSEPTSRLIEESRGRGESVVMIMDIASIMRLMSGQPSEQARSGAVVAVGFQGGRAHLRLALPAEHLAEIKAGR